MYTQIVMTQSGECNVLLPPNMLTNKYSIVQLARANGLLFELKQKARRKTAIKKKNTSHHAQI